MNSSKSGAPLQHDHLLRYRDRGLWTGSTLGDAARALADKHPDEPVYLAGENTFAVSRIVSEAEALAIAMRDLGVTTGTTVSFQLPNWYEAAVINVACALLGAVVTPIVPIYRDAEVGVMLRDSGSRLHFTASTIRHFDYVAMLARLHGDLPNLHTIVVRGNGDRSYAALLESGRGRTPSFARVNPDSVKLLLYTSGTTGGPKAVLHSHETLARCLRETARHWQLGRGEHVLMPSPVTHVTGYGMGLEVPFIVGTRTVLMEAWDAGKALELITHHQIVATLSATPFLAELTDAAQRAGTRLPTLRIFACGGAPVPPELVYRANATFAQPCAFRVYGASEVPMITVGYPRAKDASLPAATDGEVIDYEVRIVDDHGKELPFGTAGEILARGPSMFLGYSDMAATQAALTDDGFFRTGDVGVLTADGSLTVTGRKKDLIIRGGENISAKEIEDALHQHPGILEAAVVSMPHTRLGEGICAYIVARQPGLEWRLDEVGAHVLSKGLARQKCPEHIEIVPALPKTASGKVRKDLLRADIRSKLDSLRSE